MVAVAVAVVVGGPALTYLRLGLLGLVGIVALVIVGTERGGSDESKSNNLPEQGEAYGGTIELSAMALVGIATRSPRRA